MKDITERMDDNKMKWAVIGYKRECFSEEFLAGHPMDFYETESQLAGDYNFYLYDSHGFNTPSIKYVSAKGSGFLSALSFMGLQPNYAGNEDFRLKHLRMMLGEEDDPLAPVDFSDICSYFANKTLFTEAARFNSTDKVSDIVKWFRDVARKNIDVRNSSAVIVYEGTDIIKASEFSDEVSEWFGIEVDFFFLYCNDADPDHIDISFWWYDAAAEIKNLCREWEGYYDSKSAYISGEKELDMDEYCDLVRRTWWYINHVDSNITDRLNSDSSEIKVDRSFLTGLREYIKTMERVTRYSVLPETDNSKDYLFTVSAMLADELSRLAGGKKSGTPTYDYRGEFIGLGGLCMDVSMAASSDTNRVIYDIENKNYRVLLEAAKKINENKL